MSHPSFVRVLAALAAAWSAWAAPVNTVAAAAATPTPTTFYVAPEGDNARDGRAPERAWRTLERASAAKPAPGDKILFKRGGQWRGQLVPRSGGPEGPVTYGAYGEGAKPVLLGSVAFDASTDWKAAGPGLWITTGPTPKGGNLLTPREQRGWTLHCEKSAEARGQLTAAGYQLQCVRSGASTSHLQLYLAPCRITEGKSYLLRFRARATKPFKLAAPRMMANQAPWTPYAADTPAKSFTLAQDWVPCEQLYQATRTARDARFTLYLGGAMPAGAELTVADFTLTECEGSDRLPCDVGNIIFDGGAAWGVKKWAAKDLARDLDYVYDQQGHTVTLRSAQNPTTRFKSVELALRKHIIDESGCGYVIYENLDLRYGAAHGIGGGGTHHITVRSCDISWIGGGHQHTRPDGKPVRYGNGVEFWGNAHDNLVEGCRLWEIYDAALTNQNQGSVAREENITYRNNTIWNSEYSFEFWNRPTTSLSRNVLFEHNSCYGAGLGWGHAQRPDPAGRHLCFYTNDAQTRDVVIRDNIFCVAANYAFDAMWWKPETMADHQVIRLERNCWFQPEGTMVRLKGKTYTMAQFGDYQKELGQDGGSMTADPKFVDIKARDFRLRPDSPCPQAGAH